LTTKVKLKLNVKTITKGSDYGFKPIKIHFKQVGWIELKENDRALVRQ